ncbi:GNAT family N-acetyltransferase [Egbenema bharatensis]|uniref:GNAT family N-acetyltransferase n=1 Tax=Egbenema bharatensis TaxID=3463334 RepID=UPI003A88919F
MSIQIIGLSDPLWKQTLQMLRHDVYHLPEYLKLEARRHRSRPEAALIVDGDKVFFLPYLLRHCGHLTEPHTAESVFDLTSAYGYPGILLSEAAVHSPHFLQTALNQLLSLWRERHICSAFFRLHPILNAHLNQVYSPAICQITGETIGVNLHLSKEEIWRQTRSDHRKDINRGKRNGFVAKMVSFKEYIDEFVAIYKETMNRVKARQSYYFTYDFFLDLLSLDEKLHLGIVEIEGQMACGCLITECCGIVQTYLGGTKQQYLSQAPDKILFDYVRFWAKERGNEVFHLGGGVGSSKDGVYQFKAGFSKQRYPFLTLRLIVDQQKYGHLVDCRAKSLQVDIDTLLNTKFFPAYRDLALPGGSL